MEITADIQDAVTGPLNSKYNVLIAREFTIDEPIKIRETDLYIYAEKDGYVTDYAVLENKYIENFTKQYEQLMGYLNQDFKFGITLSLNRKMSLKEGFDKIENDLKRMKGTYQPTKIKRIGGEYFNDY